MRILAVLITLGIALIEVYFLLFDRERLLRWSKKRFSHPNFTLLLPLVLLFISLTLFGSFPSAWMEKNWKDYPTYEESVIVPDVIGMLIEQSKKEIEDLGLGCKITEVEGDYKSVGVVLSQTPVGGTTTTSGHFVDITVVVERISAVDTISSENIEETDSRFADDSLLSPSDDEYKKRATTVHNIKEFSSLLEKKSLVFIQVDVSGVRFYRVEETGELHYEYLCTYRDEYSDLDTQVAVWDNRFKFEYHPKIVSGDKINIYGYIYDLNDDTVSFSATLIDIQESAKNFDLQILDVYELDKPALLHNEGSLGLYTMEIGGGMTTTRLTGYEEIHEKIDEYQSRFVGYDRSKPIYSSGYSLYLNVTNNSCFSISALEMFSFEVYQNGRQLAFDEESTYENDSDVVGLNKDKINDCYDKIPPRTYINHHMINFTFSEYDPRLPITIKIKSTNKTVEREIIYFD